jgi:pyruvate,orthophosphate dikinase
LTLVYDFSATDGSDADLLGGKGAGLARMTTLGLPVPPGFTIPTSVCREVMMTGKFPEDLWPEIGEAVKRLETATGRSLGGGPVPLLLSVRSGAKFSMPGMMDTVLNIGANDDVVSILADWSDDEHFAWDVYRRFVQMYGNVVLGLDESMFQKVLSDLRTFRGARSDADLTAADLQSATRRFQSIVTDHADEGIPSDPFLQLKGAISAVFRSWNSDRAVSYRRINRIPDDLGTAANVQMMVFGDLGDSSGTGVCFTRDPASGARLSYGDYLPRAQGEDVVAGLRNTSSLDDLRGLHPECHRQLIEIMESLETHYRDMCDIEFTIENDHLYILQTRAGKRTAAAAVRVAVAMHAEGLIDRATAVTRVEPVSLEQLHRPRVANSVKRSAALLHGVAASPGAASGHAVFTAEAAVEKAKAGVPVILVTPQTTPDDIHGMSAANGILTSRGGKTSHAAVVARGMGKPAVTGAASLVVDLESSIASAYGTEIAEGDILTIDGTSGAVYSGTVEMVEPEQLPELDTLLSWADEIRSIGVRANADTPEDAALARRRGAAGIGLARTEHMFMGERLEVVRTIILSSEPEARTEAMGALERLQVADFEALLEAMDGLPVIIRLLDPPLHEFLPSRFELEREMLRRVRAGTPIDDLQQMSDQVAIWEETNPMLGLRGVRLGLMLGNLYRMQSRAAVTALVRRIRAGGDPHLEIMIPLVSDVEELTRMRAVIEDEVATASADTGLELTVPIGTMIELPRAALTAGAIASEADFFSFGTNDLTQMTYGLSRDDAEGLFLREYLETGVFASDPFQTLDQVGVGRLVRVATEEGRAANPDLIVGLCGEHGGDPESIDFVAGLGLDYVSCSPPRIEGARLAAAQAAISSARATAP